VIVCALVLSGFFVDKMVLRPQRYLMIIDTSASMAATDVKPDRLTAVKAAAVSYLRALRDNSEVALFDMNSTTTRLLDYTDDLASVERAISELNVRNTSTDPESLVSLLTAIAQDRSQAVTVALFTDGNFRLDEKRVDFDALRSLPIDVFSVGGGGDNVAITSLEIRRPAYGEGPGEVFAVVENFGRERRVFEIVMYHGVRVIRSEYIDLAPQERRVITQGLPSVTTTPVRLDILLDDDLHLDNSAQTVARTSRSRSVLLVTKDNKNLYLALSAVPGLRVIARLPGEVQATAPFGYDLVVYDGVSPGSTLTADTVVINAPLGMRQVRVLDEYEYAKMVFIDESHPVMRFVDERALVAETGQILDPAPDAAVIAYGTSGPLAVVGREGRYQYAYFGFPFTARVFVGSASFPILISNLVFHMIEGRDDVRQLSPGEPIVVPIESSSENPDEAVTVTVRLPSGDARTFEGTGDHFLYPDTFDTGIYQVNVPGREYGFAVNLFDRDELDIRMSEGADVLNARQIGQGLGQASGQGLGQASGQGLGQASGQGLGQASGQGLGQASGQGLGQASGQGPEQTLSQEEAGLATSGSSSKSTAAQTSSSLQAPYSASSLAAELEVLQRVDYRPLLIALIVLLSGLEWALYHRRWHL
jgi:Ca-activated chloride channel family protein